MKRVKDVEEFIANNSLWKEQLDELRALLVKAGFEETIKWGMPTYCVNGKNAVGLGAFKNHIGVWFHQGVFLKDSKGVLRNAQEGKTKGMRSWVIKQDDKLDKKGLQAYFKETYNNHKKGLSIQVAKTTPHKMPLELKQALEASKKLNTAFEKLTPGRQREYFEHIGTAKQEKTRLRRLEKCKPLILAGIGLNDKYKKS